MNNNNQQQPKEGAIDILKGKLYIKYKSTATGNLHAHTEVLHGVRIDCMDKIQRNLSNIESMRFSPTGLTRQKRIRGGYTPTK